MHLKERLLCLNYSLADLYLNGNVRDRERGTLFDDDTKSPSKWEAERNFIFIVARTTVGNEKKLKGIAERFLISKGRFGEGFFERIEVGKRFKIEEGG